MADICEARERARVWCKPTN